MKYLFWVTIFKSSDCQNFSSFVGSFQSVFILILLFTDVIAYVEVRTKTENRSKGVSKQLQLLGAEVRRFISLNSSKVRVSCLISF